ncbi:MAG: hypothetical protein MR940_04215 [Lachnospiraceae bacterium]|nr:hypothetical protein [Lachnospiraceae bacterium]
MKRIISVLLASAIIISGCFSALAEENTSSFTESAVKQGAQETETEGYTEAESFESLSDPKLPQYIEDVVYAGLEDQFQSEDYVIQNVKAVYISEDYLEESAYNSKSNIFFGYTLEELDKQFKGTPYVFTLGDDGKTTVVPFEDYDDIYDKIIKNIAVGTGVILVCVTVSVISAGVGAIPVSMIFSAAAKTGTTVALSSAGFSAVFAGAVTGVQTKDYNQALRAAALEGSKGFKWGAISGALSGGLSEFSALQNPVGAKLGSEPAWREAEKRALDKFGGREQVSFLNGKEVQFGTPGATRPDILRTVGSHLEAVEVKYYNLADQGCRSTLLRELKREVTDRVANLPAGSTQRVVLDVTNRNFSKSLVDDVASTIRKELMPIYEDIPVDIVGL